MFKTVSKWIHRGIGLSLVALLLCLAASPLLADDIGQQAREEATKAGPVADALKQEDIKSLVGWLQILGGLVVVAVAFLLGWVVKLSGLNPLRKVNPNSANGVMMALFGVAFLVFVLYEISSHSDRLYLIFDSASAHGVAIDNLMHITIAITLFVFFVVQIALFSFAYKFRSQPGSKAEFVSHNDKLELIWTAIPSVVLFILVGYGLTVWSDVHYPDLGGKEPKNIELVAEQFKWHIRYAGADNKLGSTQFRLTSGTNPLAMDSSDAKAADDRIPVEKKIVMVKGQPYLFKIRSKDVLHGFYMPQFRVNIYAVPGMPTQFNVTPIKTTKEMQAKYGPNFEYELACSQLCGSAHYNMKVSVLVVENEAEMNEWLSKQPTFVKSDAPAAAEPAAAPADSSAKAGSDNKKEIGVLGTKGANKI